MKSNSTAILIKIKLRHSLGRPSRSDFVQFFFVLFYKIKVTSCCLILPAYETYINQFITYSAEFILILLQHAI